MLTLAGTAGSAFAGQWRWEWPANADDPAPQVEICRFKYGKSFAYVLEMDDNPRSMVTVARPLLERHFFTDAPPGMKGGSRLPFVGSAAVIIARLDNRHDRNAHWQELIELKQAGWGILNHSYYHRGRGNATPPEDLSDEEIHFDLFWAQTLLAERLGAASTHFVYPYGYFRYSGHLGHFGMVSGSRSMGRGGKDPYAGGIIDMPRTGLDEATWANAGGGDPMWRFPMPDGPRPGEVVADFTHDMNEDPDSPNAARWRERIGTIARKFGAEGDDTIWSVGSDELYAYVSAAQRSKATAEPGAVTLSFPDNIPGTQLTLKLTGIPESAQLKAPQGGVIYRSGETVWVTTPLLAKAGAEPPRPVVKCVYRGEAKDVAFDSPVKLAGVRVLQSRAGDGPPTLRVSAILVDGGEHVLDPGKRGRPPGPGGIWWVLGPVPTSDPIEAREVRISSDETVKGMEIWIVE